MGSIAIKFIIKRIPIVNHFAAWTLDRWTRASRRRRIRQLAEINPVQLILGASGLQEEGWIETDIDDLNMLNRRDWDRYFKLDSIDAMLAEHVWEHLTVDDGEAAARLCHAFLKPGGRLRVAVPDGFFPSVDYVEHVRPGGSGPGAEDHKVLYNHKTFAALFTRAGFEVELLEYHDSKGEFHFIHWDPKAGNIKRSIRFDERNRGGVRNYTSLILDALKPTK